jgi:DNA-directed RNA polymerase II subunit RPB1
MDHKPGKSMLESFEIYVNTKLNNIFNSASKQAQNSMTDRNRVYCMVASGSKGSNLNIA